MLIAPKDEHLSIMVTLQRDIYFTEMCMCNWTDNLEMHFILLTISWSVQTFKHSHIKGKKIEPIKAAYLDWVVFFFAEQS